MTKRLQARDERGFALVELLISLVVTSITVAMVAAVIAGMIQVNRQVIMTTDTVNTTARIEALFRDDISSASALTIDNTATSPGFTAVTADLGSGGCRTSVWQFASNPDPLAIRDLTVKLEVSAATSHRADGTAYCSGQVVSSEKTTLATRVSSPVFTYANLGGREGSTASGDTSPVLTTLTTGTQPVTMSSATWNSLSIGAVELSFSVRAIGDTNGDHTKSAKLYQSLESMAIAGQFSSTNFAVLGKTALN